MSEVPILPTTWIQLIAFLALIALQALTAWQNYQLKQQGQKIDTKQDAALDNQVELAKQLNGATEIKLVAATAAGMDKGRIEGAATEQAAQAVRVATAADVAQKLEETREH